MEKHCLLFLLSLALLLGFLQALSCFQCELLNSEGICEKGGSTCETESDQQCALVEVSTGRDMLFGQQDCSSRCLNNTFIHYNIKLDFLCCHDKNLCNTI
ncbi:secreted seminal-vesicle Ly-6 protein 1-like [Mesocricetus auratus]|uniref:Secreted seminal-vesicle Ly-6 protein 1-like n=1 Tax=Mesocricetus auratus TaxID=10036 RepID=A0A1U8CPQ4_MESAU|nr:secreted seminal-vesicle Ly-6 protein 1-like [Mesocricetus auratus]